MEFNFDAMMSQAQEVAEKAANNESGRGFKYPLVYTTIGTISGRLLFNQKSQSVSRTIQRHKIGDTQVPCLRTYGMECPICKAIENIKNAVGTDLKCRSLTRGLSFMQFKSATFEVGSKDHPIKTGDIILLMYPWTVYTELNKNIAMISKNPASLNDVFSKATGPVFEIEHSTDNKYSTRLNAYETMTSASDDDAFSKMIMEIDNLNEAILPATVTDQMIEQVNKTAAELESEYLRTQPVNMNPPQQMPTNAGMMYQQMQQVPNPYMNAPMNQVPQQMMSPQMMQPQYNTQQMSPQQATQFSQPTMSPPQDQSSSSNPQCYGKYNPDDLSCQVCPLEHQCKSVN